MKALNKVPAITLYFWIIKVLCTTVGETASDFLNVNLNLGLSGTSVVNGFSITHCTFHTNQDKKIHTSNLLADRGVDKHIWHSSHR